MVAILEQREELELEPAEREELGDEEIEAMALRLGERLAPPFEKRRILQRLAQDAGPRAVSVLRAYAREPDPGFEQQADDALGKALARTPEGAGYDRNSPCPCGSGAKWKHCCAGERFKWSEGGRRKRDKISEAWR